MLNLLNPMMYKQLLHNARIANNVGRVGRAPGNCKEYNLSYHDRSSLAMRKLHIH